MVRAPWGAAAAGRSAERAFDRDGRQGRDGAAEKTAVPFRQIKDCTCIDAQSTLEKQQGMLCFRKNRSVAELRLRTMRFSGPVPGRSIARCPFAGRVSKSS